MTVMQLIWNMGVFLISSLQDSENVIHVICFMLYLDNRKSVFWQNVLGKCNFEEVQTENLVFHTLSRIDCRQTRTKDFIFLRLNFPSIIPHYFFAVFLFSWIVVKSWKRKWKDFCLCVFCKIFFSWILFWKIKQTHINNET